MNVKNIIICGDSAGGSLAMSVIFLSILRGFRVPDALMLSYAALTPDLTRFGPSMMMSLDE
jgi:acetyl esterase/lipase